MRLLLETLTPVHIGTGEAIDPYDYVIIDKLYKINLGKFVSSLNSEDKENFIKVLSSGIVKTRRFIKEKANLQNVTEYSIDVDSEVMHSYKDKINDPNNQLSIQTFIKTLGMPFVPGSSVKGAIRTALLFSIADDRIVDTRNVEESLFRYKNPRDDPFRALKISDSLPISLDNMVIYSVKTFTKRYKFTASGYDNFIEGTNSDYTDKVVKIYHEMVIDHELKKQNKFMDIDIGTIISSCNKFYKEVIRKELNFYSSSEISYAYYIYEKLEKIASNLESEKSFILRLGWGSGYDSTTINLAKERPENKISRRLIREEFPLGWVKAKILL